MAFLDIVKHRKSVRSFLDKPVEREKISTCLEAARLAPSACNSQPWRFVVVDDPPVKKRLCVSAFTGLKSCLSILTENVFISGQYCFVLQ